MSKQTLWAMTNEGAQNGAEQKKESNDKPDITSGHFSNFPELEELLDQISGKKDEIDSSKYHALARMLGYEGDGSNNPQHTSEVGNNNDADYDDNDVDRATFYIMFRLLPSGEQGTSLSEKYLNGSGKIDPTDDGQNYDGDYSWPYRANLVRDEFGLHKLDAAGELIDGNGNKVDKLEKNDPETNDLGDFDNEHAYNYLLAYKSIDPNIESDFHNGIPVHFAVLAIEENPYELYDSSIHLPENITYREFKKIEVSFYRELNDGSLKKLTETDNENYTNIDHFHENDVAGKKILLNHNPDQDAKMFFIYRNFPLNQRQPIFVVGDCRKTDQERLDNLRRLKIEKGNEGRYFASYYCIEKEDDDNECKEIEENPYPLQYYKVVGTHASGITIGIGLDIGGKTNPLFSFEFEIEIYAKASFKLRYADKISDWIDWDINVASLKNLIGELIEHPDTDKIEIQVNNDPGPGYERTFDVKINQHVHGNWFLKSQVFICSESSPPVADIKLDDTNPLMKGWVFHSSTHWNALEEELDNIYGAGNNADNWYEAPQHDFENQEEQDLAIHLMKRAAGISLAPAATLYNNYKDIFDKIKTPSYSDILPVFHNIYDNHYFSSTGSLGVGLSVSGVEDGVKTKMNIVEKTVVAGLLYHGRWDRRNFQTEINRINKAIDSHDYNLLILALEGFYPKPDDPTKDDNFKKRREAYKDFIENNKQIYRNVGQ